AARLTLATVCLATSIRGSLQPREAERWLPRRQDKEAHHDRICCAGIWASASHPLARLPAQPLGVASRSAAFDRPCGRSSSLLPPSPPGALGPPRWTAACARVPWLMFLAWPLQPRRSPIMTIQRFG